MPEQFALVCAVKREALFELPADDRVIAMRSNKCITGTFNSRHEMRWLLGTISRAAGRCAAAPAAAACQADPCSAQASRDHGKCLLYSTRLLPICKALHGWARC